MTSMPLLHTPLEVQKEDFYFTKLIAPIPEGRGEIKIYPSGLNRRLHTKVVREQLIAAVVQDPGLVVRSLFDLRDTLMPKSEFGTRELGNGVEVLLDDETMPMRATISWSPAPIGPNGFGSIPFAEIVSPLALAETIGLEPMLDIKGGMTPVGHPVERNPNGRMIPVMPDTLFLKMDLMSLLRSHVPLASLNGPYTWLRKNLNQHFWFTGYKRNYRESILPHKNTMQEILIRLINLLELGQPEVELHNEIRPWLATQTPHYDCTKIDGYLSLAAGEITSYQLMYLFGQASKMSDSQRKKLLSLQEKINLSNL
jgi:hypothetical protein